MNRRKAIGSMVIGATAAAPLALAQGSEVDLWVAWWERSKTFTLKIADAMPADSWDTATHDGIRTFGGQMVHICQAEGFYLGRLGKGAAPMAPAGNPNKAATIQYMNALFDWSIGVVKQLTPADLTRPSAGGKGPAMTGLDLLLNAMVHTAHTRGYADMCLREKGITPPTYAV
jgi:uncharacterized damage-inducible protein DinB